VSFGDLIEDVYVEAALPPEHCGQHPNRSGARHHHLGRLPTDAVPDPLDVFPRFGIAAVARPGTTVIARMPVVIAGCVS
jgi:hypothetical protein